MKVEEKRWRNYRDAFQQRKCSWREVESSEAILHHSFCYWLHTVPGDFGEQRFTWWFIDLFSWKPFLLLLLALAACKQSLYNGNIRIVLIVLIATSKIRVRYCCKIMEERSWLFPAHFKDRWGKLSFIMSLQIR